MSSARIFRAGQRARFEIVVSDYGDVVLVEVSDEKGVALDFVQVPVAKLKLKR